MTLSQQQALSSWRERSLHYALRATVGTTEMTDSLKVALAQLNPKVGDVAGNLAKVRAARAEAKKQGADLVLTAELVLAGTSPRTWC